MQSFKVGMPLSFFFSFLRCGLYNQSVGRLSGRVFPSLCQCLAQMLSAFTSFLCPSSSLVPFVLVVLSLPFSSRRTYSSLRCCFVDVIHRASPESKASLPLFAPERFGHCSFFSSYPFPVRPPAYSRTLHSVLHSVFLTACLFSLSFAVPEP